MELSEFLLARIAEDDQVAHAASFQQGAWSVYLDTYLPHFGEMRVQAFRWSPARVLADCEAKRRIVERHEARLTDLRWAEISDQDSGARYEWEAAVQLLALSYADHPDYREEWRP